MATLANRRLGDLVAEAPERAVALERLGLDYCCHGHRTLDQACTEAGLDTDDIAAVLEGVHRHTATQVPDEPVALA